MVMLALLIILVFLFYLAYLFWFKFVGLDVPVIYLRFDKYFGVISFVMVIGYQLIIVSPHFPFFPFFSIGLVSVHVGNFKGSARKRSSKYCQGSLSYLLYPSPMVVANGL